MSDQTSSAPPASPMTSTTIGQAPARRRHREGQIEHAYGLQRVRLLWGAEKRDAAIKGMLIWTLIGGSTVFMAHHLFPAFRRQTLAFKGFLTSGATIWGLCTGAEEVLQTHESQERSEENLIRTKARQELGKAGIVASEIEIEKWKTSEREKLLTRLREERRQRDVATTTEQSQSQQS